jgi:hypothetical protein
MSRALGVLLVGVTALAPIPSLAAAQGRWHEQVSTRIDQASKVLTERGFARTDTFEGSLDKDGSESLRFSLRGGREYALLAVCDDDCSNVDLRLYGENDKEIGASVGADGTPVITVKPEANGKFRLKISMVQCASSPCYYGVGLFAK